MNREFSRILAANSASEISHKINDALDELKIQRYVESNHEVYNVKVVIERIA